MELMGINEEIEEAVDMATHNLLKTDKIKFLSNISIV